MGVLTWLDEHPFSTLIATAVVTALPLVSWSVLGEDPVLLDRAAVDHRTTIYSLMANTAVAFLAVSLTALAILVALPDRPGIEALERLGALRAIQRDLLATAALCLLWLAAAGVGASIDRAEDGSAWIGIVTLSLALTTLLSLALVGLAFGLALFRADDPPDPAAGRVRG